MCSNRETEYILKAFDALEGEVVVISREFVIIAANRYSRKRRGADIVGQPCFEVFFDRKAPCRDCPNPSGETNAPACSQERQPPPLEAGPGSCRPLCGDQDQVEALVMMGVDPRRIETLEETVQRTHAFLKNLILSSVDGVIAADKTGRILIFNEAAAEITGYDTQTALDSLNITDLYEGDGARDVMQLLRGPEHGGRGKLKLHHVFIKRKNGELLPIRLNAAIVYEGDREMASIGFFHNLKEEQDIKKELEKTQIQLLQAEKMASLGKLAAGVAHQLNNPLGGITLFTKLVMEENNLPASAREDLGRILKDAERCRDTVKELLEFARQTKHLMRPHDVNRALTRTLFLLENQSLFQNIRIENHLAPELPLLTADIQQLNHLFMNIILNAAQAMEGRGTLALKSQLKADGATILIEIADTGPGIPDETLGHIFEPFFTTKEEGKGTGLGLSLAYGIVENHGGRISVKSRTGEGTCFFIELPVSGPVEKGAKDGQPAG